jgi:CrcB protein
VSQLIFVLLGSALGGLLRYLLSLWLNPSEVVSIPWGTLGANTIGCFIAGLVAALLATKGMSENMRLFIVIGFCGGFTTFSAFSLETIQLFRNDLYWVATSYVIISLLLGLCAIAVGFFMADQIF